jgi:hypothetical protein
MFFQQLDKKTQDLVAQVANNSNKLKNAPSACRFVTQDIESLFNRLLGSDIESEASIAKGKIKKGLHSLTTYYKNNLKKNLP